jgi:hypothetical protein
LSAKELSLQQEDAPSRRDRPPVSSLLSSLSGLRQPGEPRRPARELEQLNWLLCAARQLNKGEAIDDIVLGLLHLTLELTGLERGFVFLRDDGQMQLARELGAKGAIPEEDSTVSRNAMRNAIQSGTQVTNLD